MAEILEKQDEQNDAYDIDSQVMEAIQEAIEKGERDRLLLLLDPLHVADIADVIEQLDSRQRADLIALWGHDIDGDVLAELEEGTRDDILSDLSEDVFKKLAQDLDADDIVYLVEDLEEEDQERFLDTLDQSDRIAVERSLTYPDATAGRMMQVEFVTAPSHWTVGKIIDYMRDHKDLPERFYDIIIIDPMLKPVGKVNLGKIMANSRAVDLKDLMDEDFRAIPADQAQEDVAYAFNQYHMVSAPVVDETGRLVGVITIDDAMDVLEDEAEEDMKRLAGLGDEDLTDSFWSTAKQRLPWLGVNLATSILASFVISMFEGTISSLVALAVLMPIVASMGGNAATQTLTVAVRGIATRDLTANNALRLINREALVGLANGIIFAITMGIIGVLWFGTPMLGVVLAGAMVVNLIVAGLAGILVPLTLDKFEIDPALASGAFVTTVTDVVGFFSFLGLATLLLL